MIIPNLNWYIPISEQNGVQPRCPFAAVKTYPRFYQSLSLLGEAGSTQIDQKEDNESLSHWQKNRNFRNVLYSAPYLFYIKT